MLEHVIAHVTNVAGDEAVKVFLDAALKPVGNAITNGVRRYFRLRGDDMEELRVEMERLRETVESFVAALDERQNATIDELNAEAHEPAFKAFAYRAFTIAANSTLESKRRLVGTLIARRLRVKTDTTEEILLRRALASMEDLTENQLLMLAAAHLVIYGPALDAQHSTFTSRDALEGYLRPRYLPLVRALHDQLHLHESDYDTLASIGAVRLYDDRGALLVEDRGASPLQMWMLQHGVHQYDGLEGELGSKESQNAYRARFPTIILLTRLAEGISRDMADLQRRRLDDVLLTPLGATVGELVLQQLGGNANGAAPADAQ